MIWVISLVPRPYIREEKAWYTLLVHVPSLNGNTLRYVYGTPHFMRVTMEMRCMCKQCVPGPLMYIGPGNKAKG